MKPSFLLALLALLVPFTAPPARGQYNGGTGGRDGVDWASPARLAGRDADDRLDIPFNPAGQYRPQVPAPPAVLGYRIGARFTPHHRLVQYMETLAATAGDRCRWDLYGETPEGRPLGLLVVSGPAHRANLEAVRESIARLADPGRTSAREAERLAESTPIVVWFSFNVHGDEASTSETAMAVAYELAAGTGPEVTALLDSVVVIIDPCLNPDGRDRYVHGQQQSIGRQPNPDPNAWEHHQPWPGGRYNHYLFDLNRDWAWQTQVETRARARAWRAWRPQVHVDFHEMYTNSSYFFFPAAEPINANLPPQVRMWAERFGRGNAEAFDDRGWPYFTGELFDLYYPGYGDSWPTLQGATGMTYEQAGHGRAGLEFERPDGTLLTLRERVRHHFTAAMATLQTARTERTRRLADFHAFFEEGLRGRSAGAAAYLLPPGSDPGRTGELVALLLDHGIQVQRATGDLKVSEPRGYDGLRVDREFPAGTWVVPARQPLAALVHALLEPEAALPETLFYDVSAWSLPLAFGVEACWSDKAPSGPLEAVAAVEPIVGGVEGGPARSGWLLPWDTNAAPRFLMRLLQLGVRTRFATRAFELDGRWFARGTIVIPRGDNPDSTGAWVEELARRTGVTVQAARTALTGSGIDLGSDRIVPIRTPRVAVVGGDGVNPTSFGSVWFLLDRQYGIPCTVLPLETIGSANLSAYNVLVFPDDDSGHGHGYEARLDSLDVDGIERWVRAGGTLVGLKGGAAWATADRSGLTSVKIRPQDEPAAAEEDALAADDKDESLQKKFATTDEREREERLNQVPGTILRVTLDPGHPLAFGYDGEARVIKSSDLVFEPGEAGRNVAWYPPFARVSGYISADNEERLSHTPFLVVDPLGRGRCVLYNDDPNFRVFWFGLNKLFLNSLFFAGGY